MSNVIEERIVEMKFRGEQFAEGIKSALNSLANLGAGIKNGISSIANLKNELNFDKLNRNVSFDGIEAGINNISEKFSAMSIVGITALQNITNTAVDAGKKIADALTLEPIRSGFQEYETQINAVQTILANTESKGSTLEDVNKALDELNKYADMTIYNFTQMTRNIGTFTAAGVDLETSVASIKGIANLAAVSGSTSQQASTAMYQLSQALASGSLKLQDWNSVVNAGMGGQLFQEALKKTAKAHGIAVDDMIKKNGSFRESLKEGWITTDILTETLEYFANDKTAVDAATKVKTFTQLIDTLKESLQSGWTQSWETIIGDFEEARSLLTEISDTLSELINASSDSRNALLESWKKLGGRDSLIEAVRNSMQAIINIGKSVKEAFQTAFPPMTAETLYKITNGIKEISVRFKKFSQIKFTFLTEIFSLLKKGLTAITSFAKKLLMSANDVKDFSSGFDKTFSNIISVLKHLVGQASDFIGTFVVQIKSILPTVMSTINAAITKVSGYIGRIITRIKSVFQTVISLVRNGTVTVSEFLQKFDSMKKSGSQTEGVMQKVTEFIETFISQVKEIIPLVISVFGNGVKSVVEFCKRFFELGGVSSIIETLGNAFNGVVKIVKIAIQAFAEVFSSIGISGDTVYNLVEHLRKLTGSFLNSETAATRVKQAFTSVFSLVKTVIKTIPTVAGTLLNLARTVIPVLVSTFTAGVNIFSSFLQIAVNLAGSILPILVSVFSTGVTVVSAFLQQAANLASHVLPALVSIVGKGVRAISQFIQKFIALGGLSSVAGVLRNTFDAMRKILSIIKKSFSEVFPTMGSGVGTIVALIDTIRRLTASFVNSEAASDVLGRIFTTLFKFIKSGASIVGTLSDTFAHMATSVLPAIAKVFAGLIPKTSSNQLNGLTDGIKSFIVTFKNLTSNKSTFFTSLVSILSKAASSVSGFVKQFAKMGGIESLSEAIYNSFASVLKVAGLIQQAFSDIFQTTGANAKPVYTLVENFRQLTSSFLNSETAADRLSRIFKGVFALFDIGKNLISSVVRAVSQLVGVIAPVGGGFFDTAAGMGDFIVRLDETIRTTGVFDTIVGKVVEVLKNFMTIAMNVMEKVKAVFSDFKSHSAGAFDFIANKIQSFLTTLSPVFAGITELIKTLVDTMRNGMRNALNNLSFDNILDVFNAGALTAIVMGIKSLVDSISGVFDDDGILGKLTDILDGAKGCLESWQQSIKVGIIKQISTAIGILAISLIGLSLIDEDRLVNSLTAVGAMLGEVMGTMAIFTKIAQSSSFDSIKQLPTQLMVMSISILILTSAVSKLAAINWDGLAKGIIGIGALLAELGLFIKTMGKFNEVEAPGGFFDDQAEEMNQSGLTQMVGLLALAEALNILATAMTKIAALDWDGLAKGVIGIGVLLGELGLFLNNTGGVQKVISTSIGITIMSTAMLIFAKAVKNLGGIPLPEIIKGLYAMAVSLAEITVALKFIPTEKIISVSIGLIGISAAILILSSAVQRMGEMSWESIGKSLLSIAVSLTALVLALNLSSGGLAGAAGILAVAAAITILTPALMALGSMSLAEIGKSLLMIVGVFAVMAAAGALLTPLIPTILSLGGAMLMLGAAVALLGVGTLALSAGLSALVLSLDTTLLALVKGLKDIVLLICDVLVESAPALVHALVVILDELAKAIGPFAVDLLDAVGMILIKVIEILDEAAPKLIDLVVDIIMKLLERITAETYKIIECGMMIIDGILRGIADNIQNVIEAAVSIVVNFVYGIVSQLGYIIDAGINLIISFIDGLAEGIDTHTDEFNEAGDKLIKAIINGIVKGVGSGIDTVVDCVVGVGEAMVTGIKDLLGINSPSKVFAEIGSYVSEGFANGISSSASSVENASDNIGNTAVSSMNSALKSISDMFSSDTTFSPTISPVVDMTNVRNGASNINDMFSGISGNVTISSESAYEAAQSVSEAMNNSDSSNNRIANAISGLSDDFKDTADSQQSIADRLERLITRVDALGNDVSKMQVVLDSGALVGQISSGLDSNLGFVTTMKRRGV